MAEKTDAPFSTRLENEARTDLKAFAHSKGLSESAAGRMLILEKLAEWKAGEDKLLSEFRKLTALTIAALSETIDFDQAQELVEQHLGTEAPVVS